MHDTVLIFILIFPFTNFQSELTSDTMISTDDGPASEEAWERELTDVPMSSPEVGASVPSPEKNANS
jgi:hypothetical protein